jgi:hypothetical protein
MKDVKDSLRRRMIVAAPTMVAYSKEATPELKDRPDKRHINGPDCCSDLSVQFALPDVLHLEESDRA